MSLSVNVLKKVRKATVLLAAVLAIGHVGYRIAHRFPGRFLVAEDEYSVYRYDMWGLHLLKPGFYPDMSTLNKPTACRLLDLNMLALAPDGKSAAYIQERQGRVGSIMVRRVDKTDPARAFTRLTNGWESCDPGNGVVTSTNDLSKFSPRMPYCSNLEWSPDGKYLAFADNTKLYIVNAKTGGVKMASIPEDKELAALTRHWEAYEEANPLPAPKPVKKDLGGLKESSPEGSLASALAQFGAMQRVINAEWKKQVPLSAGAKSVFRASNERVKSALGLDENLRMYVPASWQRTCSVDRDGGRISAGTRLTRRFDYVGRPIRWVAADTIYCDNLKLKLSGLESSGLRVSASKTPLVTGIAARPCWSPTGDKAAYIVNTHRDNAGPETMRVRLVVVDAKGKVIWKCIPCADVGQPRWSRDGRYLAIINYPVDKQNNYDYDNLSFIIYEVGTTRSWKVPVPTALFASSNVQDWQVAGWDWEL